MVLFHIKRTSFLPRYLLVIRGLIPVIRRINMCINISLTLFFKTTTTKHFSLCARHSGRGKGKCLCCWGVGFGRTPLCVLRPWESRAAGASRRTGRTSQHSHSGMRSSQAASPKLGSRGSESSQILPDCIPHPTFASGRRSGTSFWSVPGSPEVEVPALSRSSSLTFQAANKNWAWPFKTPVWISHLPNDFMSPTEKVNFLLTFPPLLQ